ncbi:PocR ligand-binding domain-containing protein [Anaerobacillus sp. HL2]|nr:PocR ligand-binding domain-containing protein [Anaerobacillus sp. HL2]
MCHSGFIDFAAPIVIEGQYLGTIMGGQVVSAEKNLI